MPASSPELIDAVRKCAAKQMSYAETADELTTRAHPLNRSTVAGIAGRNGISFSKKKATNLQRPAKDRRTIKKELPKLPAPNAVTVRAKGWVKPPRPECSWAGCTSNTDEGSMFCFGHGKRGLFG